MTAWELIGLVALLIFALALPALGDSVRRSTEDRRERDLDAEFQQKIDAQFSARINGDRDQ